MSSCYRFVVGVLGALIVPMTACAGTVHVPADQPTIQQGLDAADSDDMVLVAPDTYSGPLNRDLDFDGKSIVLMSESGAANTFIDCDGLGRGFRFHSGEDTTAVVQGFTIMNAVADSGAGAFCSGGSSPRFEDCMFTMNSAIMFGGALYAIGSSPVIRSCTFELNEVTGGAASHGGALALTGGSSATVADCECVGNTATADGGAVFVDSSAAQFIECSFTANSSSGGGGGAAQAVLQPAPTFTSCVFTGNSGSQGGAIYTQSSPIVLTDCDFIGNSAPGSGGALALLYSASTAQITSCTFVDNGGGPGGALTCFDSANAVVGNCTFVGNSSGIGVIYVISASPTVENTIIAFSDGGVAATCSGGGTPVFSQCVLFGNTGGDDLCGVVSDTLHRDPRFCWMEGGDLTLCLDSPCSVVLNPWGHLIGALDVGCGACGSAVAQANWGTIKAMYR
jgi:predicted outer membrane repeat protein